MRIRHTNVADKRVLLEKLPVGCCFKYVYGDVIYIKSAPDIGGKEIKVALHSGLSYSIGTTCAVLPLNAEVVITEE